MRILLHRTVALSVLFSLVLASITNDSQAQFNTYFSKSRTTGFKEKKQNRFFHGLHIGYNYAFPTDITIEHQFRGLGMDGYPIPVKEDTRTIEGKPKMSLSLGSYAMLATLGHRSIVALTYGLEYFSLEGEIGNVNPMPGFNYDKKFTQQIIGMPIGVAYKFGGEASYVKTDRFSVSAGIAAAPAYVTSDYADAYNSSNFRIIPMAFAEVGVFGGMQFKLRGSCYPLGMAGVKIRPGDAGMGAFPTETNIHIFSQPIFQVGIAIMPFSYKWNEYHW